MKLFNQQEQRTVYVIDTSGLIMLESTFKHGNPVFSAIWEEIEDLIFNDCFKTIDFVEEEIQQYQGKQDFLKKWVAKRRKQFVVETDGASFLEAALVVNAEHGSGFLNPQKQAEGKEEADPYLIGYCKVHGCVLITNESKTKDNKIPAVAKKHQVKCIDLYDFLQEQGLRMERRKTDKK